MTDMVQKKNIAALLAARLAAPFTSIVAGGAGNNVAVAGPALDRAPLHMPQSAAIVFPFQAQLAAGQTLTLTNTAMRHSPDGVNWTPYQPLVLPNAGLVATGPAGGGAVSGAVEAPVTLDGALEFIQVDFTPVLSAANTDTAVVAVVAMFGGFDRLPAPV